MFMDLDSIPSGVRFAERIAEAVESCDVVLVLIGPEWLNARDADRRRRLDDPRDWVLTEVAEGLRSAKPVVPVLVSGASMPEADDLPDAVRELAQ